MAENKVWVTRSAESNNSFSHEYIHLWSHMPVRKPVNGDYFTPLGKMITIEVGAFERIFGYLPGCDSCELKRITIK